jgi:hypothetical protein
MWNRKNIQNMYTSNRNLGYCVTVNSLFLLWSRFLLLARWGSIDGKSVHAIDGDTAIDVWWEIDISSKDRKMNRVLAGGANV